MIEEIEWDSYIVIKTQEINVLKQEITEIELQLKESSPEKQPTRSKDSSSQVLDTFHSKT